MEAAPHPWPALGVLLMRDGLVTKDELEAILDEQSDTRQQRISGRRLGELLVERGVVSQLQVSALVAEQYELPFVDLDVADIDLSVASLLPEELGRRFSAVAVSARQDGSYLLAIADPGTVVFSDELRRTLGGAPSFAVVGPDAIDAAIEHVYRQSRPAVGTVDELVEHGVVVPLPSSEVAPDTQAADQPFLGSQRTVAHLWPPLGALLVREGLLTDTELEAALAQQRLSPARRLGEILVDRGTVAASTVARLVAEQYELPFVDLADVGVDPLAARLLSEDVARRCSAVPVRYLEDGSLQVVVADPTNVLYSDELRLELEVPLRFAVAGPDEIDAAITAAHEQASEVAEEPVDPWFDGPAAATVADTDRLESEASPEIHDAAVNEVVHQQAAEVVEEAVGWFDVPAAATEAEPEPEAVTTRTDTDLVEVEASAETDDAATEEVVEFPTYTTIPGADDEPDQAVQAFGVFEVFELEDPPALPFESAYAETSVVEAEEPTADVVHLETEPLAEPEEPTAEVVHLDEELLAEVEEAVAIAVVPPEPEPEPQAAVEDEEAVEDAHQAAEELELDDVIHHALSLGATSVQLAPRARGVVVRARIDGAMHEVATLERPAADEAVRRLAARAGLDVDARRAAEGLLSFDHGDRVLDLRVGCIPTRLGLLVNVRVPEASGRPSSLAELGLTRDVHESLRQALRRPSGVVVVSGAALSGRTTTLHAALQELATPDRSLASVEDPVDDLAPEVAQVEVDVAAGVTVARGLRAILRAGADAVLAGDLPDEESANVAFRGARAERVVLAAVEAPTAVSAAGRLQELCDARLLSTTLSCLVAQHLVRRICTDCRETYFASAEEISELGRPAEESGRRLLARGRGCDACGGSGHRGWAAVFEALPLTGEMRMLLAEGAPTAAIRDAAREAGMSTLREAAVGLCLDGVTSVGEVRLVPLD